ncbi:hypothetical protein HGRIS_010433 [Hohenbuehelia grisea]|uniref:Uncharacterized protein n=1 Tax=Hohenbuehelia grisea TaxID=104357 RepID=A0ABR3J0G2_9AGAR
MPGANYMGGKRNAARARAKNVTLRTQKKIFGKQRLDNLAQSLSVAGKLTAPSKSAKLSISTLSTPDISVNANQLIVLPGRSSAVAGIELGHAKRKQEEAHLHEPASIVHYFMPTPQTTLSSEIPQLHSPDSPISRNKRIRSSKILSVLDESEPLFLRAVLDKIISMPDLAGLSTRKRKHTSTTPASFGTTSESDLPLAAKRQRILSSTGGCTRQTSRPGNRSTPYLEYGGEDEVDSIGTSSPDKEHHRDGFDVRDHDDSLRLDDYSEDTDEPSDSARTQDNSAHWLLSDSHEGAVDFDFTLHGHLLTSEASFDHASLPASSMPSYHSSDGSRRFSPHPHTSSPSSLGLRHTRSNDSGYGCRSRSVGPIADPGLASAQRVPFYSSPDGESVDIIHESDENAALDGLLDHDDPWGALDAILGFSQTTRPSPRHDQVERSQVFTDVDCGSAFTGTNYDNHSTQSIGSATSDDGDSFSEDEIDSDCENEDCSMSPKSVSPERSPPCGPPRSSYRLADSKQMSPHFDPLQLVGYSAVHPPVHPQSSSVGYDDDDDDDCAHDLPDNIFGPASRLCSPDPPVDTPTSCECTELAADDVFAGPTEMQAVARTEELALIDFVALENLFKMAAPARVSANPKTGLSPKSPEPGGTSLECDVYPAAFPRAEDSQETFAESLTVLNADPDPGDRIPRLVQESASSSATIRLSATTADVPSSSSENPVPIMPPINTEPLGSASYPLVLDDQQTVDGISDRVEQARSEDGLYLGPQLFLDSDYDVDD